MERDREATAAPKNAPADEAAGVTNLLEAEARREEMRRSLRFWHLFVPVSGDDLVAYRSVFKYVTPYRGKFAAAFLLALVSAVFLAVELLILQGGLEQVLGDPAPSEIVAEIAPDPAARVARETEPADDGLIARISSWGKAKRDAVTNWVYAKLDIPPPPPEEERSELAAPARRLVLTAEAQERKYKLLWLMSGLLVVSVALAGIAKYGQANLMTGVSTRVVRDIRIALFRHLLGLSVRFHQRNHSAQLISRITYELEVFGRFLTDALVRFVQDFFELIAVLTFVALNQGSFIFVVAGVIALAIAPVNMISRKLRKGDRKGQAGMAEVVTVISEALTGQRIVKAFASEEREYARFRFATRAHLKQMLRLRRLRSMAEPIVMTIGSLGIAAIIIIGGARVLGGRLDSTSLVVNVVALGRAMGTLRRVGKQLNEFQIGLAAADRVGNVLQSRSEIAEKPDASALPPFHDSIRFEGVHFAHERRKPTLHGIDLAIRRGETVALVGPSGAGKTTIIDLVPRFYDVDRGRITIDGHDVRDVTLRSLREQIGIVTQETILFRDSIRDNIAYGRPDATDEQVEAAARAANAHDFIARTPAGYRTLVGERGFRLSGGERQRLAIARALLLDPPILILDEATSALDSDSEAAVQAALQRLMKGRTVIVIAHRLSTIRHADKIVVLVKGRVVETGTHDELMARPDGVYRRHHEMQTRRGPDSLEPEGHAVQ